MKTVTIVFKSIQSFVAEAQVPDEFEILNTEAIHGLIANQRLDVKENLEAERSGFLVDEVTDHATEDTIDLHSEACALCQRVRDEV